jgi:beta-galactosidase GanA
MSSLPSRLALALLLLIPYSSGAVADALAAAPSSAAAASQRHTVTFDHYSLMIDGKRTYIWSGELQYWRLPSPGLWKDVLQKMKSAGFNAVTMYFSWGYHSPRKGVYDFSGVRNVDLLLDIAQQVGLYVIARPGPYIEAESDSGGLPGWLTTIKGTSRSTAPDYTAAYEEWLSHIDAILVKHQLTHGTGPVILYQPENEFYDASREGRQYMQAIENKARADGITVPLLGNDDGTFASGVGAVQLPGYDSYPQDFDCSRPGRWSPPRDFSRQASAQKTSPLYFPEFQGGSFDPWGGPGYAACRRLTGPDFERVFYEANIVSGATLQNFYMTFGGTSWGWLAYPGVYTSYDYGAAINESRQLTAKYYQQKLLGYFVHAVEPLTRTERLDVSQPTDPALRLDGRVNPIDGTRIYVLRHADATSNAGESTHIWINLPTAGPAAGRVLIPRKPGTDIRIHGRDSRMFLANYRFGGQWMLYSTSELLTNLTESDGDLIVLYGTSGDDGETVLSYPLQPNVAVLAGRADVHWDAAQRSLRLDYVHEGLIRIRVEEGGHDLLLLIGTHGALRNIWRLDTPSGPLLVSGPYLVRTAAVSSGRNPRNTVVSLTGDTDRPSTIEVFGYPDAGRVIWNGGDVSVTRTLSGSLMGQLGGPKPVPVPRLTDWKYEAGGPEISAGFDDSAWIRADHRSTSNPFLHDAGPVLDADEYGFHHGDVWYRGHFTSTGREKGVLLTAGTGANGVFTAWLNGHYLGRAESGRYPDVGQYFNLDSSDLKVGADNVLAVLVDDMGHEENDDSNNAYKEPRGLISAAFVGSDAALAWRLQGNRGGEALIDPVRGPYNNGGLFGERNGWSLPGYPDGNWRQVKLPHRVSQPGIGWYRATFTLRIPADQDVPLALEISDDPVRHYRALIFVNGWQFGRYINALGPQHVFVLPPGILNPHGTNTIAVASWSTEYSGGLGNVRLVGLGNYLTSMRPRLVSSPAYDREKYAGHH